MEQARTVGAAGPFLSAVMAKSLDVSDRVRQQTAIGELAVPSRQRHLIWPGTSSDPSRAEGFCCWAPERSVNRPPAIWLRTGAIRGRDRPVVDPAREMAEKLGGTAATLADRWKCMLRADIVISATGCPHVVLTREEAETNRNRAQPGGAGHPGYRDAARCGTGSTPR